MPAPSYTYTLTNSTTADATQVMQNFNDILNGISDGTKDLSISALTVAGTATLNGTINLGNASGDDLTITASLASSLAIKTTFTYDIGSATIGLRSVYLGSNDSAARSVRVIAGVIAASYTLTLPIEAGSAGERVRTNGSGALQFIPGSSTDLNNIGLTASVAANALTIALKGADGSDASATNPADITFRSATATTGTPVTRAVTGSLSLTISSGSTLGHASGKNFYIYVYAIDNAGTVELAASSTQFDEGSILTTTAEGAAGAADSFTVMYSATARTGVGIRLLGRLKSNQATAGTWATAIAEISLVPFRESGVIDEDIVTTGNGHGSTNTKVRYFIAAEATATSAVTRSGDATLGILWTVNETGLYVVEYSDAGSGGASIGISVDSNQLTTALASITATHRKAVTSFAANFFGFCSATLRLKPGQVVRAHTDGTPDGASAAVRFRIAKIAD